MTSQSKRLVIIGFGKQFSIFMHHTNISTDHHNVHAAATCSRLTRTTTKEGSAIGVVEAKGGAHGGWHERQMSRAGKQPTNWLLTNKIITFSMHILCAQNERDDAICRAKRTSKHAEKTAQQLAEAKAQLAELKSQLIDAAEHKIAALERGRKVDDLHARVHELESEKTRLVSQLSGFKSRCRATIDTSLERGRRDEHAIHVNFIHLILNEDHKMNISRFLCSHYATTLHG